MRCDNNFPTVVFPEPVTPMTRIITRKRLSHRRRVIGQRVVFRSQRCQNAKTGNSGCRCYSESIVVAESREADREISPTTSSSYSARRLCNVFLQRLPIMIVPTPVEVVELAFGETRVIEYEQRV